MVAELHSAYVNYRMPPLDAVLSRRRSNRISSRHLEWGFLHVRALQCAARFFPVADAALLAAADDAPRQISSRPAPEVRRRSADSRWPRRKTRNLGARGFGGRGGGFERGGQAATRKIPVPPHTDLVDDQQGAETRGAPASSAKRIHLSAGLCLRRPPLSRRFASGSRGRRRN